ncbi:hypothetical protein [Halobacillus salinus]|uniref:hypothetical protein n=1 Tax=Halobacillus salinus TaxID=192814 RepID=UPI0009A6BCAC|nr:hypothetical protein [Halobacillus salinus]
MVYRVIRDFRDTQDNHRTYEENDVYPFSGEVSEDRVNELLGTDNKIGKPVIEEYNQAPPGEEENDESKGEEGQSDGESSEEDETDAFPKHSGGPYYELSNGEKVKGKEAAIKAEKELT